MAENGSTIEALQWRYAVKEFDAEKKLSEEQVEMLLEALRLAPSSFGLQPWGFVLVEDADLRKELVAHSWGQPQVVDASHLIVLCRKASVTEEDADRFMNDTAKKRGQDPASLEGMTKMIKGFLGAMDEEKLAYWMKDQVYLALGSLLSVCAVEGIDACPMEGFAPAEYDRILGLEEKGLRSVVVCPVGFRGEGDKYASLAKVRYAAEEVVVKV